MFRAKDTICITMQISIIKFWQFIFPWERKKNVFHAALFLMKGHRVVEADLLFKLNGLS